MPQQIVNLTDEEEKALLWDMVSIQEWINNAIHNKARQCVDALVEIHSGKLAAKLNQAEKYEIIRSANIQTAAERNAELEAAMK